MIRLKTTPWVNPFSRPSASYSCVRSALKRGKDQWIKQNSAFILDELVCGKLSCSYSLGLGSWWRPGSSCRARQEPGMTSHFIYLARLPYLASSLPFTSDPSIHLTAPAPPWWQQGWVMTFLTSLSEKTTPSSSVSRGQRMKSLLACSLSATLYSNHLFLDPLSFFFYPGGFCWGFRCDQFKLFNPLLEISLWRLALLV